MASMVSVEKFEVNVTVGSFEGHSLFLRLLSQLFS